MADPQDNGPGQQPAPQQQPQPQGRPDGVGQDWKLLEAPSGDQMWFSPDQAGIAIQRGAKDVTPGEQPQDESSTEGSGLLNYLKSGGKNLLKGFAHGGLELLGSTDNTKFGKFINGLGKTPQQEQQDQENFNRLLAETQPDKGSIGGAIGKGLEQAAELMVGGESLDALRGLRAIPALGELGTKAVEMSGLAGLSAKAHHENPGVSAAIGGAGEFVGPALAVIGKTAPAKIVSGALRAGKSRFFGANPAQELVDSGIMAPTTKGVTRKIGKTIAKSSSDVSRAINDAENEGKKINVSTGVTMPFEKEAEALHNIHFDEASQKVTDYLNKILNPYGPNASAARAKLTSLKPSEAQFLKDKVLQEVPKYSVASLKPGGEESNPIGQAAKGAAHNVRLSMEQAMPNIAEGNRVMHNLIAAREAIQDREAAEAAKGWRPSIPEMVLPAIVGEYTHSLPGALAAYGVTKAGESLPAALLAAQAIKQGGKLAANPLVRRGAEGIAANVTRKH